MLPRDNLSSSFPSSPSQPEVNDFCHAARDGDVAKVKSLLDQYGSNIVNRRDDIEARALTWAAFNGRNEIVNLLLDRGADINAGGTQDKPALGWAAEFGHVETVGLLLDRGASLDVRDRDGRTPLELAQRSSWNGAAAAIEQWVEDGKKRAEKEAKLRDEEAAREVARDRLRKLREGAAGIPTLKKIPPRPGKPGR